MDPLTSEMMDVSAVCRSFPQLLTPRVERKNVLETIEDIFKSGAQLVAMEGEEGIGKTTLLAEFALRHNMHTIALFVRPTSRLAYDPWYLQFDLSNQLEWLVHGKELEPEDEIDEAKRRIQITHLQGRARRDSQPFYVIVDGLDEVPESEGDLRKVILDLLPLGIPGYRFLVAGLMDKLPQVVQRTMTCRSYRVTRFSLDETVKYFEAAGIGVTKEQAEEIRHICQGLPGRLASVMRTLANGINIQVLLDEVPTEITQLLEFEWQAAMRNSSELLDGILAVLAHDLSQQTLTSLAELHNCSEANIATALKEAHFINIRPDGEVTFASRAFKEFAARKLSIWKSKVNTLVISRLSKIPDSDAALTQLPTYLAQDRQFDRLFEYLSPQHFVQLVGHNQSLGSAVKTAELGLQYARQLHRDPEIARLSLNKALFQQLEITNTAKAEIEARMALHDNNGATVLAQAAALKEDRLQLLAIVAKGYHVRNEEPPQEILDQLSQLAEEVDTANLGDRALHIAQDLIYSHPDQAIRMVEEAVPPIFGEGGLDRALTVLSVGSAVVKEVLGVSSHEDNTTKRVTARIRDPRARGFAEAVTVLFNEDSTSEVIDRVKGLSSTGDQVFILRRWATINREQSDAWEVVDFALKNIIASSDFSPNAGVYRDLAEPIPYITDEIIARRIVGQFDSQRDIIEQQGPTQDYIKLQLTLAKAESRYDSGACYSRFIEIYARIDNLEDLSVQTECTALLVDFTEENRNPDGGQGVLSTKDCELVRDEFSQRLSHLLNTTADHYRVTRSVIRALSSGARTIALDVARSLNTEVRRNRAILDLIELVSANAKSVEDSVFLQDALGYLTNQDTCNKALTSILERIADASTNEDFPFHDFGPFLEKCDTIGDSVAMCQAYRFAYITLRNTTHDEIAVAKYQGWADAVRIKMQDAWNQIDVGWDRIEAGFQQAKDLADIDKETAKTYLDLTESYRDEMAIRSWSAAEAFGTCLLLAIRAFVGLLPGRIETQIDLLRLASLIDVIPSSGERTAKWALVAMICYIRKRDDLGNRIVAEYVKPTLQDVQGGEVYYRLVLRAAAPALWQYHAQTAKELIEKAPAAERDGIYGEIAYFVLHKSPPIDRGYSRFLEDYDVTYEELVDLCDMANEMHGDNELYTIISEICSAILAGRRIGRHNREQQRQIIDRLWKLLQKFPDHNNIQHEGYKLIAEAQLLRVDSSRHAGRDIWADLIQRAETIPNASDSSFVLAKIALTMPSEGTKGTIRQDVLTEAGSIVASLPSYSERVECFTMLAEEIVDSDYADRYISLAKQYLKNAMTEAAGAKDKNHHDQQRRIIDIAYQFDEELAQSLASQAIDDPARLKEQIQLNQLTKNVAEPQRASLPSEGSTLSPREKEMLSEAAWRSLISINSKSRSWVRLEHIRNIIGFAAHMSLAESYPLMAWAIEHTVYKYANDTEARARLTYLFDSTVTAANLALQLGANATDRAKRVKDYSPSSPATTTGLIRVGDREAAIRFIRTWFEQSVHEYVKIADPYFGPDELEWVRLLADSVRDCRVQVLTSRKAQQQSGIQTPWEDSYNLHWKLKISDQEPPDTEIVVAGRKPHGDSPIHDRFIITKGGGLAIGASLHDLGITKDAKITILPAEDAEDVERKIDQCLNMQLRTHRGEKVQYSLFNMLIDV